MIKKISILFAVVIIAASCGQITTREQASEKSNEAVLTQAEKAFLANLASLCDNSFSGKETYMQPGRESWAHKKFVMHVTVCDDDKVHIPFHLDEDRSRTWMFLVEEGKLRFRHDHRHEDGTPEDQTLYGGYADGSGTEFIQRFPADDYTKALLNDTLGRQWNIILAEDLSTMAYQLEYLGEVVFAAEFDLTDPL
jgi:hypothetical protein